MVMFNASDASQTFQKNEVKLGLERAENTRALGNRDSPQKANKDLYFPLHVAQNAVCWWRGSPGGDQGQSKHRCSLSLAFRRDAGYSWIFLIKFC